MKKIELKCGAAIEVDESALDNMELIDALAEAQTDNPLAFSTAMLMLVGKGQRKQIYAAIKEQKGSSVVSMDDVGDVFTEIVEALGEQAKNS